jgi:hypothetical protein
MNPSRTHPRFRVRVTRTDIDEGERFSKWRCAIILGARHSIPGSWSYRIDREGGIRFNLPDADSPTGARRYRCDFSRKAKKFARTYDEQGKDAVGPVTILLTGRFSDPWRPRGPASTPYERRTKAPRKPGADDNNKKKTKKRHWPVYDPLSNRAGAR